ncbi:MAG: cytochrome c biogenesis protein CcsA [Nitrosomonadales bacterium]|nr:cytochrome c biogenesis protein CcsA [Nitrosomonadales bacterium]
MSNLPIYLLTFLSYGVLAGYFWRAQTSGKGDVLNRGMVGHGVLLPLSLHAWLLSESMFSQGQFTLGLGNALSLMLWLTMLVYWLARFIYPISGLQALVLPLAAIGSVLPELLPAAHPTGHPTTLAFEAHIAAAMLAYSLLTIAMLHAVLISSVEKRLHHGTLPMPLRNLPPLLTMETLLFRLIWVGFVVLSLTLTSGILFSEELFGKPWQFGHKNVFGLMSWLVFAALLFGHRHYGWRGRIAVRWTVSGFVFLLLAYVGTEFVLEVLLDR